MNGRATDRLPAAWLAAVDATLLRLLRRRHPDLVWRVAGDDPDTTDDGPAATLDDDGGEQAA